MPHRNERHAHRADGDGIPVPAPVRAVVVGGGVSGLVAARVLAISGHAVEVFEAEDERELKKLAKVVPSRP